MPEGLNIKLPEEATSYVCLINQEQVQKLEKALKDRDWGFKEHPYAYWKATFAKMTVVAYKSGKLVVQGKGTGELVLFTIEPEITGNPILGYEGDKTQKETEEEPFVPHAGVDESGKGDIFGSLTIASVFVDEPEAKYLRKIGVKDSKTIKSDAKIAFLAKEIKRTSRGLYSIVSIGPDAYNRLYAKFKNLNRLLAWGHARAIENMLEKKPDLKFFLSDKFAHESLLQRSLMEKGKKIELIQKTKAESDIAVAAASILARNAFVEKIKEISKKAGFNIPRGAGCEAKKALDALIREKGRDCLANFAKMHFKTVKELVESKEGLVNIQ